MTILFPMAGNSSRFFNHGFEFPKYMLPLGQESVFRAVLKGFEKYGKLEKFVFVIRDWFETERFIERELGAIGFVNAQIVVLDKATRGQAETAYLGLEGTGDFDSPLYVFNIDTIHSAPILDVFGEANLGGVIEIFRREGHHWSFVDADDYGRVRSVAEKKRISDLCSTGFYSFSSARLFMDVFEVEQRLVGKEAELYIAPMYNRLVAQGMDVRIRNAERSKIWLCGTPDEYVDALKDRELALFLEKRSVRNG